MEPEELINYLNEQNKKSLGSCKITEIEAIKNKSAQEILDEN